MPINLYFDTLFAQSGDVATVPDASQPSGVVSYTQGFTAPYSLAPSNPSALLVPRTSFNQIIKDITAAIQNLQQNSFPLFITSTMNGGTPFPYNQYAVVNQGGTYYVSLIANNTDTPPSSNWAVFNGGSSGGGFSTGDAKLTWNTSPDTGWILMNDGTIGSASSGATYANANSSALYDVWWNGISNTYAPVPGGRGISASADFLANKPIGMPTVLCRALIIAGAGSGLTPRTLGQFLGDENLQSHIHTIIDPAHTHSIAGTNDSASDNSKIGSTAPGGTINQTYTANSTNTTGISINPAGTGSGGNMQPSGALNLMAKL